MPSSAVIPRIPVVPRTAQPPYSHVENSTRAELDQFGVDSPKGYGPWSALRL